MGAVIFLGSEAAKRNWLAQLQGRSAWFYHLSPYSKINLTVSSNILLIGLIPTANNFNVISNDSNKQDHII